MSLKKIMAALNAEGNLRQSDLFASSCPEPTTVILGHRLSELVAAYKEVPQMSDRLHLLAGNKARLNHLQGELSNLPKCRSYRLGDVEFVCRPLPEDSPELSLQDILGKCGDVLITSATSFANGEDSITITIARAN